MLYKSSASRLDFLLLYEGFIITNCACHQMLSFIPRLWTSCSFRFMFTPVRHSFTTNLDKKRLRKETPMFHDILFGIFQRTYKVLSFIFIQIKHFPAKTSGLLNNQSAWVILFRHIIKRNSSWRTSKVKTNLEMQNTRHTDLLGEIDPISDLFSLFSNSCGAKNHSSLSKQTIYK